MKGGLFLRILDALDTDDLDLLRDEAVELLDGGDSPDQVAAALAKALDVLLPLDVFLPGFVGELAEKADEAAFLAVARAIVKPFARDPERRARRKARRSARKAG